MSNRIYNFTFFVTLIAALTLTIWRGANLPPPILAPQEYQQSTPTQSNALAASTNPIFEKNFLPNNIAAHEVHSAAIITLTNGGLLAAWFGGSREGASDIAIYATEHTGLGWSETRVIADRVSTAQALGREVRKLGNPVLAEDNSGRIWLFFVIVSLGGWSTSAIAYKTSVDGGKNFIPARLLVTSPFLNISTLVRTRTLSYADGSLVLPAYHELLGKFGLILRIGLNGQVLSLSHIGNGRTAIQPSLVALNQDHVLALLRRTGNSPAAVLVTSSNNGAANWDEIKATNLPNPDSSVAAINGPNGELLLVYNHSQQGRNILSLAQSTDGNHWQHLLNLEHGAENEEFSYPFLIRDFYGDYHLVYTWKRQHIMYIHFNRAWLKQVTKTKLPNACCGNF